MISIRGKYVFNGIYLKLSVKVLTQDQDLDLEYNICDTKSMVF